MTEGQIFYLVVEHMDGLYSVAMPNRIETNLTDAELPTASTLEYLVKDDLADMNYNVGEIKAISFERTIVE